MRRFYDIHTNYSYRDRRGTVSLKENTRNYIAKNPNEKEVLLYRTDSGEENNRRCDYALYIMDSENESQDEDRLILIELKGKDIERGISQITQTLEEYITRKNIGIKRVDARMVVSRSPNPRLYASYEKRLNLKLKKKGNGRLCIQTRKFEETI